MGRNKAEEASNSDGPCASLSLPVLHCHCLCFTGTACASPSLLRRSEYSVDYELAFERSASSGGSWVITAATVRG